MKFNILISIVFILTPHSLFAVDSYYCPKNHAYIKIGMTTDQIIAACGPAVNILDSNIPHAQKVPVKQLIYNNQGTDTPFSNEGIDSPYRFNNSFWAPLKSGSGGAQMEIDIVDNKIKIIRMNSSNSNAASVCNGVHLNIGDNIGKVYNACGSPSIANETNFIEVVPTPKPTVWVYQEPYQSAVSLTFVNGKLQSID